MCNGIVHVGDTHSPFANLSTNAIANNSIKVQCAPENESKFIRSPFICIREYHLKNAIERLCVISTGCSLWGT